MIEWLKTLICGRELAALKAEIERIKKDLAQAWYERDKALNRAAYYERQAKQLCYELNTREREEVERRDAAFRKKPKHRR